MIIIAIPLYVTVPTVPRVVFTCDHRSPTLHANIQQYGTCHCFFHGSYRKSRSNLVRRLRPIQSAYDNRHTTVA